MNLIDSKQLSQAGFKYLGVSYDTMDCQAFVERCLKDCGKTIDLPGSNAWYRKMNWTGTPEECKAKFGFIPKGAFLFILKDDGKEPDKYKPDGKGNASHIGIKTGTGKGAIHSSQSVGCVAESVFNDKTIKNGGWNRVGLWTDEVDYGLAPSPAPDPDPDPEPEPEPEPTTATAWAESGSTVNIRKRKSTLSKLVERVPIGDQVTVLEYGDDWCKVSYTDDASATWYGYMKTKFLIFEDDPGKETYTVIIPGVDAATAAYLCECYPGATATEGVG